MARIRTIKPEFWRDEDLSSISAEAALLAIGLLNYADDEGYFSANKKLIECDVFPLRNLSSTVPVLLQELSGIGYVRLFDGSDNKQYGQVANFVKHQVISKPRPSKIKGLDAFQEDSGNGTGTLQEDSGNGTGAFLVGKERKGKEKEWNGGEAADTDFKISLDWKPSQDAKELIKIARGKLPTDDAMKAHLANFVGYWRTRDDTRRQDQWDHAYADWVVKKETEEQRKNLRPEEIYINVLGQQIDTSDKHWELFKNDNDQHTPERFRIDKEATRTARKQVAA